jgi:hypothetical protein
MSYFNHAFQKAFVGTGGYNGNTVGSTTAGLTPSSTPQFAFYDQNYNGVNLGNIVAGESNCCPLILASASFRTSDMIGPYHGGYQESNKSKVINPKYVTKFYRVDNCDVQQAQVLVGQTNLSFENPACCKEFLCDETYYLRVDIKGSPALEFLTRNAYLTADAYTGCCADPAAAPTAVNPLIVYVQWAYNLLRNQTINPFISVTPTYTTDNGVNWTAIGDGTSSAANLQTLLDFITGVTPYPAVSDCVTDPTHGAGLIIDGAYVDTRFADCTFYPTDGTKAFLEPVVVLASEVDFNGDPCAFTGICVVDQCDPIQLKGSGEKVIREVMLTEAYRQQPTHTGKDLRIREITGGTDIFTAIPRNAFYTRYFIEHVVPRFNNPSGVFDNDRYLLEIVANPSVTTFATGVSIDTTPPVADETGIGIGDVVYLNGVDTTLTVASVGPLTLSGNIVVAAGDVLTFLEANLHEFEVDVNGWLACANGGQECVQLEIINCNGICTPADPEVIVEGIG